MTDLVVLQGPAPLASPARAYLEAQGSASTARTYRSALARMARLAGATAAPEAIPWHLLRYEHAARLKALLIREGLSPATVNLHLAVLRGVVKTAWRMGLIDAEGYARIASIEGVRGSAPVAGRALRGVELGALLGACQGDGLIDARDGAIVALCAGAGLRRAEASAMDRIDLVRPVVNVRQGKGRKAREAAMPPAAWSRVLRWCELSALAGAPLFVQVRKGSRLTDKRLSPKGIRLAIARRADAAGLGTVTAHDLRRTFVTDWLGAGVDPITVSRAAGHASVDTTRGYDRRRVDALIRAAELVPFPA